MRNRRVGDLGEPPAQRPLAHDRVRRKRVERQIRARIFPDMQLDPADARIFRCPCYHLRTKLGLPAFPSQNHHHEARDIQYQLTAMILLDQRKRQVYTRHHPGRGPEFSRIYEDRVTVNRRGDFRVHLKPHCFQPVRCNAMSVCNTRRQEHCRARADRSHHRATWLQPPYPRQQRLILRGGETPWSARDQKHMHSGRQIGAAASRCQFQKAASNRDGSAVNRYSDRIVQSSAGEKIRKPERLERTADIRRCHFRRGMLTTCSISIRRFPQKDSA